jgi:hypothetical protein
MGRRYIGKMVGEIVYIFLFTSLTLSGVKRTTIRYDTVRNNISRIGGFVNPRFGPPCQKVLSTLFSVFTVFRR